MDDYIQQKVLEYYQELNGEALTKKLQQGIADKDEYYLNEYEIFIDKHMDKLTEDISKLAAKDIIEKHG